MCPDWLQELSLELQTVMNEPGMVTALAWMVREPWATLTSTITLRESWATSTSTVTLRESWISSTESLSGKSVRGRFSWTREGL